ncbi:SGNH/GDSL hydrolase family protein [Cryptosporangium sp. NPDC048952]|uniref:SGNH/GDSL hydrolase family protein n=1 Tax=Cryptosporangium sp. NPDC048952 TaxID=3363961 RepID=UPI00371A4445
MTVLPRFAVGVAVLLLSAACSGPSAPDVSERTPASRSSVSPVVLLGDSVAAGQALPLTAAFAASGVRFRSLASDGGGNVVGPFSDKTWPTLPRRIADADPSVVVYQITTYDWGSRDEQTTAYRKLLATVTATGAALVFVTMPPIRPDDFYAPHVADLDRTGPVARAVVSGSGGRAHLLDATAVWGSHYQRERDGRADRSTDGIHACPQGAARFANWLLGELAKLYPDFTPAEPDTWANTGWANDKHFVGC